MNIVEFTEKVFDIRLLESQKRILNYINEHPNVEIIYQRERPIPYWLWWYMFYKCFNSEKD